MIFGGKPLLPLRSGYNPEIPNATTSLKLPGGVAQVRREVVKPITTVRVEYLLDSCFMIQWYKAWYRQETAEGALSFTARLAIDNTELRDYTVQFASAPSIIHNGYRGLLRCTYEVLSRADDDNCDHLLIYDELGNCSNCSLEKLSDAL